MSVPSNLWIIGISLLSTFALLAGCSSDQQSDGEISDSPALTATVEPDESVQVIVSSGLAVEYESVESLARESDLIVRGTVAETLDPIKVEPGEPPFEEQDPEMYPPTVYTDVVLEVSKVFKGDDETRIAIRQVGGTIDDLSHEYEDALDFAAGDDLILFLADHSEQGYGDVYWVTGIFQGFWEVTPDGEVQSITDKYESRSIDDFRNELNEYASSD